MAENEHSTMEKAADEGQIGIVEVIRVLSRNWKIIVLVPIVVAVLTALGTLLIPNIYTAKAMIIPKEDDGGLMGAMLNQIGGGLGALAPGGFGGVTTTDLYVTMMRTETVEDPIIDRFKLLKYYKVNFRTDAYIALNANTDINAGKKDGVITVAVSDRDPKLAALIANAFVEELGNLTARLSTSGAGFNRNFLEKRLSKSKADLAAAEESLKNFQIKNKSVAVADQVKSTLESVAQMKAQLAVQEVQLASMRQQYTEQSTQVKSTKASINAMRQQIARLEGAKSDGSMPSVGAMPELGQEYIRLMREFKTQETLVELLTKQYELAKINESKNLAPFQILQHAKVPELKSKPQRAVFVILSAILSLFITVLFVFCKDVIVKLPFNGAIES